MQKVLSQPKFGLNKSLLTNTVAFLLVLVGYLITNPLYHNLLTNMGLFALSGALTNWIAIYMLFEKVPFCYGSGVIPNRFEAFKASIKNLVMREFFNPEHVEKVLNQSQEQFHATELLQHIDYEKIYTGLKDAILSSQFGPMISMMGGESALEPLKDPIIKKIKEKLTQITEDKSFHERMSQYLNQGPIRDKLITKVEVMVDERLNELTPQLVKNIVQEMIQEHLGWLVVWGGAFGALIGLAKVLII